MTDNPVPPTPAPGRTVTTVGQSSTISTVAGGLFSAFQASPVLLLIVILNGFFIGSAGWYMLQVEAYRADDRKALTAILDKCTAQSVPIDYLIRAQQR